MDTKELLFSLLRYEIDGERIDEEIRNLIPQCLSAIYNLAKRHDLAHLLVDTLDKNDLFPENQEIKKRLFYERNMAVYRYEQIKYELGELCRALEEAKIPYMPLKGSVIRQYYPEFWMRTSCDIDILVRAEDLEKAGEVLISQLNYKFESRYSHDVSYYTESGVHVELHFNLAESNEEFQRILCNIWGMAKKSAGKEFEYIMNNELLVSYHIAHMAGHFLHGGCGIRPFLDLWLLKTRMGYDTKEVERLLAICNLTQFGENAFLLSEVWFSNAMHTDITREMEEYIVGAGVYGTLENKVAINQAKRKGKVRYIFSRIFLPYSKMKRYYPKLEKYPILLPFYHIKRWCIFIFKKDKKRALTELQYNNSIAEEKKMHLIELCNNLGLQ